MNNVVKNIYNTVKKPVNVAVLVLLLWAIWWCTPDNTNENTQTAQTQTNTTQEMRKNIKEDWTESLLVNYPQHSEFLKKFFPQKHWLEETIQILKTTLWDSVTINLDKDLSDQQNIEKLLLDVFIPINILPVIEKWKVDLYEIVWEYANIKLEDMKDFFEESWLENYSFDWVYNKILLMKETPTQSDGCTSFLWGKHYMQIKKTLSQSSQLLWGIKTEQWKELLYKMTAANEIWNAVIDNSLDLVPQNINSLNKEDKNKLITNTMVSETYSDAAVFWLLQKELESVLVNVANKHKQGLERKDDVDYWVDIVTITAALTNSIWQTKGKWVYNKWSYEMLSYVMDNLPKNQQYMSLMQTGNRWDRDINEVAFNIQVWEIVNKEILDYIKNKVLPKAKPF